MNECISARLICFLCLEFERRWRLRRTAFGIKEWLVGLMAMFVVWWLYRYTNKRPSRFDVEKARAEVLLTARVSSDQNYSPHNPPLFPEWGNASQIMSFGFLGIGALYEVAVFCLSLLN